MASLSINESPLSADLLEIVSGRGDREPYFMFHCIVHTEDKDIVELGGVLLGSLLMTGDYINNISDYIEATLLVRGGTFVYDIYPYLDNIEITIVKMKQERYDSSSYGSKKSISVEERYKAFYLADQNTDLPDNKTLERDALNKSFPVLEIKFQLVSLSVIAMKNSTTQGSYSSILKENEDMSYDSLLRSILSTAIKSHRVDTDSPIDRIEIEPVDNKEPLSEVTIPTGTPVMSVANYLHEYAGGMYTGGVASYIKQYSSGVADNVDKVLFVYSLYNVNKWNEAENKMIMYIPVEHEWSLSRNTNLLRNNIFKVMTNAVVPTHDTKTTTLRSDGEGFRTANASAVVDAPVEFTDDGPVFKKSDWLNEIIGVEFEDGLINAPYRGLQNNNFVNAEQILAKKGRHLQISAEHVDSDYYYPGMPVNLLIDHGNNMVEEAYGIIHAAATVYEPKTIDITVETNKSLHVHYARTQFLIYITES